MDNHWNSDGHCCYGTLARCPGYGTEACKASDVVGILGHTAQRQAFEQLAQPHQWPTV